MAIDLMGTAVSGGATPAFLAGAARLTAQRHPSETLTSKDVLSRAFLRLLHDTGIDHRDIDGLGVSSFGLDPDRAIDLAWQLGLSVTWIMDDIIGMNMFQHAVRAIQHGDARTIVLLGGDSLVGRNYGEMVDEYNAATRDHLAPLPAGGPNSLFAMLTARQMTEWGLSHETYGELVRLQRSWAGTNPDAAYRDPLSMADYLTAPRVADPLTILDCPPLVASACAVVLRAVPGDGPAITVDAIRSCHNFDHQDSDGLQTGLSQIADALWEESGVGPNELSFYQLYDDYPAVVLAQLVDLGIATPERLSEFLTRSADGVLTPLNTSGGMLTAGQAGAGGGLDGLVEAVLQLQGRRGAGQIRNARVGVVAGYGMVLYRYGACAVASVLQRRN